MVVVTKKNRLIFAINSSIAGGAQIYLINLIKGLKDSFDILLILKKGFLLDKVNEIQGVEVFLTDFSISSVTKIRHLIKSQFDKYAKVYVNPHLLGTSYFISKCIEKRSSLVFVPTLHNKINYDNISLLKRLFFPIALKKISKVADSFITVSDDIANELRSLVKKHIIHIPSFVPLNPQRPKPRNGISQKEVIVVGFVGRLSYQKNPILFIDAAVEAKSRDHRLRFELYGDGELHKDVESEIENFSAKSFINLNGFVSDINEKLKNIDILVITSKSEGTPLTLLEAMSFGVPVVSTEVGGIPSIIHSGENGLLVDKEDKEALVNCILLLLSNDELYLRFSANLIDAIYTDFNYERNINKYKGVFENDQ